MKLLAALLIASVLLLGCVQPPGGGQPTEKPISEIVKEDVPTPSAKASVTPLSSPTPNPEATTDASPTPSATITTTVVAETQEFTVEMDDNGWYPNAITMRKGVRTLLTMKLRTQNVYFGGADVKSSVFNELGMKPGETRTVAFVPETSFQASNIWPSSNVLKGTLQVNVS